MINIKAIIFDMDGVLIDAKDWHYEALNRSLNLFGYHISRHEHLTTYDGLPTKVKLKMLTKEKDLPEKLHTFISKVKQIYTMELISAKCKPIFQHEYALSQLKLSGFKLGLASNAIRKSVESMLDRSDLMKYMDFVISNEDVTKPKPDPEIYLKAMKALKVSPDQTLILEDNEHGILSARASGASVMEIDSVEDVHLTKITDLIQKIEKGEILK